jgi:hypothetical protein
VFGLAIVGFAPRLHRTADVPGGMVPHEQEGPLALGRNVHSKPRENGAGDQADGTPPHKAQQHLVGCRHIEPITGNGFPLCVLSWDGLFHQADGLVGAHGMPLGLGFTAPPHCILDAQGDAWIVGGHL